MAQDKGLTHIQSGALMTANIAASDISMLVPSWCILYFKRRMFIYTNAKIIKKFHLKYTVGPKFNKFIQNPLQENGSGDISDAPEPLLI